MLPPSTLDRMPDAFVELWQGVEDEILKRLEQGGKGKVAVDSKASAVMPA